MSRWFALSLLALLMLSGCAAGLSGNVGAGTSTAESLIGQLDQILPHLIADKYISLHNLQWELWQIDQTQGPVMTVPTIGGVSTPPITVTPPPTTPPSPVPTPMPTCPPGQQLCPPANLP